MTKKVLVTDYVWPSVEPERAVLAEVGAELVIAPDGNEETLISLAKDVSGILTCFEKVTEKVIRAADQCIVIGRYGVGVDNIDVKTATELGIVVTYVPDYCVDEVSDHVFALLLSWNRRIVQFDNATKRKGWGSDGLDMRIMRLKGKKIGIVGFGRIGKEVAKKARAFGMDVLATDPFLTPEMAETHEVSKTDLEELLRNSEFVTLHAPLMAGTKNLIGKEQFKIMRSDAFLINAARGPLIDENALRWALTSGEISGAGLDVLVDIAPGTDHPIVGLDNVIVTPHTAFFSQEAVLELEERAAAEVGRVLRGEMPENPINSEVFPKTRAKFNS